MSTVKEHYEKVLSDVYSWMNGGFEAGIKRNEEFFHKQKFYPRGSGIAVDLGAGCGFQSIPMARKGYFVSAIDLDTNLLNELENNSTDLDIKTIQTDLIDFDLYVKESAELIVCMTDTILHLESKEKVKSLFDKVFASLEDQGQFVITFRDLTFELKGTDRFLPVKSDKNIIFTCFLEYEPEIVKVHDIVYKRSGDKWELFKSFFNKLRLSEKWMKEGLLKSGFKKIDSATENGMITIIASK